jgi:hypothetical protein
VAHTVHPLRPTSFLLFGGELIDDIHYFNETLIYNTDDNSFSILPVTGDLPPPRGFATAHTVCLNGDHHFLIFGGQSRTDRDDWSFYNDLWIINLEKPEVEGDGEVRVYKWVKIAPANPEIPEARVGHRSCIFGDQLYVFGGCFVKKGRYTHFNDLWRFDLRNLTWTELPGSELRPSPRHSPSLSKVSPRCMVLSGGAVVGKRDYDDIWSFDVTDEQWTKTSLKVNSPRDWFAMTTYSVSQSEFILFSRKPQLYNLSALSEQPLPAAGITYASRGIFKNFDFCMMWQPEGVLLLRTEENPWSIVCAEQAPTKPSLDLFELLGAFELENEGVARNEEH